MADFSCHSAFCVINNPRYDITYKHNEEGEIIKDENGKAVTNARGEVQTTMGR